MTPLTSLTRRDADTDTLSGPRLMLARLIEEAARRTSELRLADYLVLEAACQQLRAADTVPSTAVAVRLSDQSVKNQVRHHQTRKMAKHVFQYWQFRCHHPRALYTPERANKLVSRLREGSTPHELCHAIDGCASSAFHMGDNRQGARYDDILLIVRDRAHIETMSERTSAGRDGRDHPYITELLSLREDDR